MLSFGLSDLFIYFFGTCYHLKTSWFNILGPFWCCGWACEAIHPNFHKTAVNSSKVCELPFTDDIGIWQLTGAISR